MTDGLIVSVPRITTLGLLERMKESCKLDSFDADLAKENLIRDDAGKTFEVLVWRTGSDTTTTDEVRENSKKWGFVGNTSAFMAWLAETRPDGRFVSIPDDEHIFRVTGLGFCIPYYTKMNGVASFSLFHAYRSAWESSMTFVAFREIKS